MDRREAASGTPESNVPDDGADPSSVQQEKLTFVAKADWVPTDPSQLRLVRGDTVQLLKETDGNASGGAQWWWVERIGTAKDVDDDTLLHDRGYIPSSYVRRSDETTDDRWQNDEYFGEYSYVKVRKDRGALKQSIKALRCCSDVMASDSPRNACGHSEDRGVQIRDRLCKVLRVPRGKGGSRHRVRDWHPFHVRSTGRCSEGVRG